MLKTTLRIGTSAALIAGLALIPTAAHGTAAPYAVTTPYITGATTATPVQHLVVIFQENVSFDHYFGTYPKASNPAGEPAFQPLLNTPTPNNYLANPLAADRQPQQGQPRVQGQSLSP